MKTIEYKAIDKTAWPRGPWDDEPDKVQWEDEATGLPCLAIRKEIFGHWCGYVGVYPNAFAYEKDWTEEYSCVNVHGGITYNAFSQYSKYGVAHAISAALEDGEPDHFWWFGFDCAHAGDLLPAKAHLWPEDVYRDLNYVKLQCAALALQLSEL